MITVVPATLEHAARIELRAGDAREIEALGVTKKEALATTLGRSIQADAYLIDGEVAALMGITLTSLIGGTAAPWLMTGRPVERHRKAFMRLTRERTQRMLAEHGTLVCNVHAEYARSIRWLRWLGFEIAPARPFGPLGAAFHEATLRKGLHVGPCSIADIAAAPNLRAITEEFAAESLAAGLPRTAPNWDVYRALESAGLLHPISARLDGELVGFIGVLFGPPPRHVPVATTERFFVVKAHRKTGAGLKLLKAAEEKALALGSPALQVVAPFEGSLFRVLPRVGYRESNRVYLKMLPVAA